MKCQGGVKSKLSYFEVGQAKQHSWLIKDATKSHELLGDLFNSLFLNKQGVNFDL